MHNVNSVQLIPTFMTWKNKMLARVIFSQLWWKLNAYSGEPKSGEPFSNQRNQKIHLVMISFEVWDFQLYLLILANYLARVFFNDIFKKRFRKVRFSLRYSFVHSVVWLVHWFKSLPCISIVGGLSLVNTIKKILADINQYVCFLSLIHISEPTRPY